ncbi:uncharacterized protein LOC143517511 [Brachyhypopomus gauderio]|uniref:uncharacterized protein LOC143517511 n=1 Tax=Brachyhypopomus gauderio TaxID=698409 RepID=UPI0040419C8D
MDPLNQLNAMRLQEPLPSALDLSMGCKQTPTKTSSAEVLDLVKKPSWSDCNSGTNDVVVGAPGSRSDSHVSKPFKQVQPDFLQLESSSECSYEPRCSAVPLLNPSSVSLLNGLPPVTETLSQCPNSKPLFTDDSTAGAESDKTFTQLSEYPRKALIAASEKTITDTTTPLRARNSTEAAKNGLPSQSPCAKTDHGGKCTTDTVSPRTRSRGGLGIQDGTPFTPSFHTADSASFISEALSLMERPLLEHKHTAVETLSSGCNGSAEDSSCSIECISSDGSDVIEVCVSNSAHRQPSTGLFLTGGGAGRRLSLEREALYSPRQGSGHTDGVACGGPEHVVTRDYHTADLGSHNPAERVEPCDSSPPTVLDGDPDVEFVSKSFPSTSDAENAERSLGPPRDEGSSVSPSPPPLMDGPQGAPASKKKNQGGTGAAKLSRPCPPGGKEAANAAKRRKRKARPSGSPSIFGPQEPEIKLKYANYKEKREDRDQGFAPYIRVELSACTIVNFREEDEDARVRKGRQAAVSCVSPGVVPSTSRLVLGRASGGGGPRPDQACCLCGRTSDTSGLGDLHGPYCPCGPQSNSKVPRHPIEGGAQGGPRAESPPRVGGVLDGEEQGPAKRPRNQGSTEMWPGAPEGAVECGERWVHEDCSVWSAGVFLVKGKLYGLEEVLRLTRETVCSCCHRAGATLACFFRDCPNKYHFPCAVQADCVLSEENFTMRCPKHKNKSPRAGASRLQSR